MARVRRPRTGSPLTWGCVEWWALPPRRLNHLYAHPAAGAGNLLWGAHVGLDQGTVTCQGPLVALQLPRSRHPGCDVCSVSACVCVVCMCVVCMCVVCMCVSRLGAKCVHVCHDTVGSQKAVVLVICFCCDHDVRWGFSPLPEMPGTMSCYSCPANDGD